MQHLLQERDEGPPRSVGPAGTPKAPVVTSIAPLTGSAIVAAYDVGLVGGIGRLVLEVTRIVRASRR